MFQNYTHVEESVQAMRLNATNQAEIVSALATEAENGLLAELSFVLSDTYGHYQVAFRYQTDKVVSRLMHGDYLVRLNAGNYIRYSAEDFEAQYLNTSADAKIPEADQQTPSKALLNYIWQHNGDLGVENEEQLTKDKLDAVLESLRGWYNEETNVFDIKFTDCSMVSFEGYADLLKKFTAASYMNENTQFTLNFNNGAAEEGDNNCRPNQFNYIALQGLLGEIKLLGPALARRIIGASFKSVKDNVPSAVAASVTDAQWREFVADFRMFTSAASDAAVLR